VNEERHNDNLLSAALQALAADEAGQGPSSTVEARLRAELRSRKRLRRQAAGKLLAIAAALLMVVSSLVWSARRSTPATVAHEAVGAVAAMAMDFWPLTYSTVPLTGGEIIRLEVPSNAPEALGVESATWQNGSRPGTVLADVLVGDDGLARAVRFVRDNTR